MVTVLKSCAFTILTLMATEITAQEISCFAPASVPVAGAGSQPTVSRALLLFSLFIFFNYLCNSLLSNTEDDDPYAALMSIDSEPNLFANVTSNNLTTLYEESVPNQTGLLDHHELFSDSSQIGSLTSSVLQEFESTGNEQNNLHSENREEGTLPRGLADEERVVLLEEVDDAVERSSIDLNTLDSPGLEERLREYVIDLNALILPNSEEIEQMDGGRSHTEHNLPAEERGLAHEERVDIDQVAGLDEHVVVIDSDTSSSSGSEEIEPDMEYGRRVLRGETSQPHGVDTQIMQHVNETTVDDHINNCSWGITFADLQQQSGKKVDDAARSLGVSRSTFKRICRANGIARWSCKRLVQQPATATLTQSMATTTVFQSDNNMSVKVSYNGVIVKFPLSLSSGKNDLEVEIEKRFGIETGSFWIKYEDEEKEWILITCDEDLHHGMQNCMKTGITTMRMLAGHELHKFADLFLSI